jgi:uncharacterized membrane protein YuzA (DUF378 family)
MRGLGIIAGLLLILGGLNLGLEPLIDKFWIADLVDNRDVLDIIYVVIGVAAVISIPTLLRR